MAKNNDMSKGFTMAELLVVVAIIAVLVAIAIPVFSSQLKNARLAVDHSAIRDAYAIVQVANNTHEVVINGKVKTFEQLDSELPSPRMNFCLSKDCSSLVEHYYNMPPDSIYILQENGADSSGVCSTCKQWDNGFSDIIQQSTMHIENCAIFAVYDKATQQLYLGFTH